MLGDHWDEVIKNYKEIELSGSKNTTPDIDKIINQVKYFIQEVTSTSHLQFLSPHVIDLSKDGFICKMFVTP